MVLEKIDLIERELIELGFTKENGFVFENINIKRFDFNLFEVYKNDKLVFEGVINSKEDLLLLFNMLVLTNIKKSLNSPIDYYNSNIVKKGDFIEYFNNKKHYISKVHNIIYYPRQQYILVDFDEGYTEKLELPYSKFKKYNTSEEKGIRELTVGETFYYFCEAKYVATVIHNYELGACLINDKIYFYENMSFTCPDKLFKMKSNKSTKE